MGMLAQPIEMPYNVLQRGKTYVNNGHRKVYKSRKQRKEIVKGMGYVYVIQSQDYYKVGVTKGNPQNRMKQLQTGSPVKLRLVRTYKLRNYEYVEKEVHKRLARYRTSGEWFDCDLRIIEETISNVVGDNMYTIGRIAGIMWTMVLVVTISIIVLMFIWPETMLPLMGIY